MSYYSNKEKMESSDYKDICRNHSAKADREMYRVCPSKLSKRELEDLYFTLLENNLELKKTINGQQDKIRVLSTQVQRMTYTQEKLVSKEMKDRGTATKAVVDEQKDFITELKETNQRLSDRVQHLNMRLCSAKQFMKTTPPHSAPSKGNRSSATAASTPKRHDCRTKGPESPEQVLKVSTYSQWEEKSPKKDNQKQITVPLEKKPVKSDQPCDENKCRSLMEEMKLKIATLQTELVNVHGEYATRIGRLETEVLEVRKENIRVISERSASECELTDTFKRASDLLAQYRTFEAKCAELTTELAIERRKVAELETQLKAANMSDKVNKTIEDHLTTKQETSGAPDGGRKGGSPRKDGTQDGSRLQDGTREDSLRKDGIRDDSPRKDSTQDGSHRKHGTREDSPRKDGIRDDSPRKDSTRVCSSPDCGTDGGRWWWWTGVSSSGGSRRGDKPRNSEPDIGTKDGIPKDGVAKDGIPKDAVPKDASPKDAGSKDASSKDAGAKDAGAKDGVATDSIPKDCGPKDASAKDAGSKDASLKDATAKNAGAKVGIPKDCGLKSAVAKDAVPKDGGLKDEGPKVGGPRAGIPKDGVPKDDGLKKGVPKDCSCKGGIPKDGGPIDGVPRDGVPKDGVPKDDGREDRVPKDEGCKDRGRKDRVPKDDGPTPPLPPPPPVPAVNEKAPIKGLDDTSSKSSPKYSVKSPSSGKYSCCGTSLPTTATTSEDTNCETCGCKFQLMSEVQGRICSEQVHYYPIPAAILTGKCAMCGYTPHIPQTPPESTSTPVKDKNNDVVCQCPAWVEDDSLMLSQLQDKNNDVVCQCPAWVQDDSLMLSQLQGPSSKCMKCCFQDKLLSMGSPPRTHEGLPPSGGATSDRGGPSTTNTGDDSGYQDTDEQGLLKQNKELIAKILELQRQVDCLKIRGVETPVEQIEQSLKDEKYESLTPVPSQHVIQPRKIIRIEVLGNPKESSMVQPEHMRSPEETRAKTIEDADGKQYITDDPVPVYPDKYGYPDLSNKRYKEHKWDSPKLEIVEKEKHGGSIAANKKHDSGNITLKSATNLGPGPGFNPEKFKYLEAEGLTADVPKLVRKESLESIPSNPELGFGIPNLASKISQERSKAEMDSGRQKKSLGTSAAIPLEHANLSLSGTNAITSTQTDDTNKLKEDCQYCTACSFDNECAHAIKLTMDKLALEVQKERDKKHDQHNSLQIPGPLSSNNVKKEKKKSLFSHFKKQKKGNQSSENLVIDPRVYAKKTSITAAGAVSIADVPLLEKSDQSTTDYILRKDSEIIQKPQDKKDKSRKRKKESQTKDGLIVNSRVYAQRTCETAAGADALADVPLLDKQVVGSSKNRRGKDSNEGKVDTNQKLPEKSSQAPCYKDSPWQSDESPYRRHSGTYCYRAPGQGPAVCRCVGQQDGWEHHLPKNKGTQAADTHGNMSPREKRRAVPTSERGTYTLDSKQTDTSPDNTDLEMSYLSDLPMEKEKKSPLKWRPLSPGEDRSATYSSTQTGPSPPTNYSLSEGEMPAPTKRRHSEPDRERLHLNAHLAHKLETQPSQQIEEALQAITNELQRCKYLLHHQRPAEPPHKSVIVQTSATDVSRAIALRPGVATQGIGDARAPMSVFTLHVGTAVFSDEAVLSSRNMNLVLKWQFYNQAATMTRMRAGRVMLFDFSTEYDIKVTEHFLNYLKYERMPIIICELGREDQPFASCSLPLRDALLHINTRADMSIALMAGPQMLSAGLGVTDNLDKRDEVGVIDLWCMLRIEASSVPGITLPIPQPSVAPKTREERHSGVLLQGADDYNELEISMVRSGPAATHEQIGKNQSYADVGNSRPSDTWSNQVQGRPPTRTETAPPVSVGTGKKITYDPSKYPPLRRRESLLRLPARQLSTHKTLESEMIMNEVIPKIKTPEDIKFAMDRSNRLNDVKARTGRSSEELLSLSCGSHSSLRSILIRLQKRGSPCTQTQGGEQRNFIKKLRKANPTRTDQSKKVTINPEHYFGPDVEEPQKDVVEEQTVNENQTRNTPKLEITVLWLALNEECEAMLDPRVQRVYVAYTFLGRSGADLETPVSLPKPKHYVEKCYFNFKKVFELENADFSKLRHMAKCRASSNSMIAQERDCIIFSVVSEPAEDPLGIESCEDIGYAYLYLGDLLTYSAGSPSYTEVVPVRAARGAPAVCGVLAVRMDGLDVVRRCLLLTGTEKSARSRSP